MDIDRKQRTDIDTVTNDRLTLAIDEGNIIESPYVQETIESFVGNNWIITDNVYVKYNLVEDDTIIFNYEAITELAQKDITKVTVSFDYLVENIINVLPVLTNVSLNHSMITYKTVDLSLSDEGHVDIDCSLFDIDNEVLNAIISSQGFGIGLSFNGKLSNVTLKLSNVKVKFKFDDKLLPESNSVVNRLEPYIDFYRDGDNLILQVGGDASGKGMDRGGSNTYTKEEIDNKLAAKVNTQVGKMLSSNDYTNDEKTKLSGIEANANYYIHPFTHDSSIIVNSDALTNLDTSANATQSEINQAIDDTLGNKQDGLISGENIKTINNESVLGSGNITIQGGSNVDIVTSWGSTTSDSKVPSEKLAKNSLDDKISKSSTSGLVKNDGTIDTTTYSTFSGSYADLSNKPSIPSKISDLTNDSDFIETSSTSGLVKNDGSIDTTTYSTFSGSYNDLSNKPTIPANVSDLNNDSGFITSSSLPTKTSDLQNDGDGTNAFLTQHQSLSNYIQKSNTNGLLKNDGSVDTTSYSTFSGSYNDLSNKPTIPTDVSDLTDTNNTAFTPKSHTHGNITTGGQLGGTRIDTFNAYNTESGIAIVTGINNQTDIVKTARLGTSLIQDPNSHSNIGTSANATQQTINNSIDTALSNKVDVNSLSTVATTGDYDDLIDKPIIPSKTSDIVNDSGFITSSSLPTKVSDLQNDTGFITSSSLPTKTSDLTNDGDGTNAFLTQHQSLSNYIQKSNTSGLIKNDGSIDTNTYLTQHQSLTDYVQKNNGANTMTDSSAYSTIGTSANATQKTINAAIDSKLDDIYDTFLCENLLFDESDLLGGS